MKPESKLAELAKEREHDRKETKQGAADIRRKYHWLDKDYQTDPRANE